MASMSHNLHGIPSMRELHVQAEIPKLLSKEEWGRVDREKGSYIWTLQLYNGQSDCVVQMFQSAVRKQSHGI